MKTKQVLIYLSIAFSLSFCSTEKKNQSLAPTSRIKSPFKQELVSLNSYRVSPELPAKIQCKTGTCISIPSHAFVDLKGNPVQGEVQVKFREFHSVAEIIASGIPMKFTENGKVYNFESAGMFEIAAECNGETLKLASGKSIGIELASGKADKNFNFYSFDTSKGQWIELSKNIEVSKSDNVNDEALALLEEEMKKEEPLEPRKASRTDRVFELDVDYSKYPELEQYGDLLWKFAGKDKSLDPSQHLWALQEDLDNFELTQDPADPNIFRAVFRKGNLSLKTLLTPVLGAAAFDKAMLAFKKRKAAHEAKLAARKAALGRTAGAETMSRTLRISGLGIYNCDRFINTASTLRDPKILVKGRGEIGTGYPMYLMAGNKYTVAYSSGSSILYDNSERNSMIIVFEDDTYAVLSSDDFEKAIRNSSSETLLVFTPAPGKATDINSFNNVLLKL